jgi:hypothetical protein
MRSARINAHQFEVECAQLTLPTEPSFRESAGRFWSVIAVSLVAIGAEAELPYGLLSCLLSIVYSRG